MHILFFASTGLPLRENRRRRYQHIPIVFLRSSRLAIERKIKIKKKRGVWENCCCFWFQSLHF